MPITSVDDIAAGLQSAKFEAQFHKSVVATTAANSNYTTFYSAGTPRPAAQPPLNSAGTGYACSNATTGSVPITAGNLSLWLAKLNLNSNLTGSILIFDRVWAASFTAPTVAGTVAITTPGALPARITDGGQGLFVFLESYTAGGASGGTFALNYLDETGAAKTGPTFAPVSVPAIGRTQLVPLAAGSKGISQVVSFTNSATMTSGTYVIALKKLLAIFPVQSLLAVPTPLDWAMLGIPPVSSDACIEVVFIPNSATSSPMVLGRFTVIDK